MKKLLVCYITLSLLLILHVCGQPQNSSLRFTNYTTADGLPTNSINDIMQGSRGFMWLSTAEGLARYNGRQFTVYRHNREDSNSMPNDNVNSCIEVNNNELVFSSGHKLWMLNTINQQQHAPPDFWKGKPYTEPYLITKNVLCIYTLDKVFLADFDLNVLDSFTNIYTGMNFSFYTGDNKIIFSNAERRFCYTLNTKKIEEWEIPSDTANQKLYYTLRQADTLRKIMYASNYFAGVFKINYDPQKPLYLKPEKIFYDNLHGLINNIFNNVNTTIVSTSEGLLINGKTQIFCSHSDQDKNSILYGSQHKVMIDNAGNYWAIGENGISRFNLQQLNYSCWKLPYEYPSAFEHYEKFNSKLWMSSLFKGSLYLELKTQQLHIVDSSIVNYCWGVKPVNNNLYIYGNSTIGKYKSRHHNVKLLAYNSATKKITKPIFLNPYTKDAELVTLIYQSHNKDVWYSINNNGGLIVQQHLKFTQYSRNTRPPAFNFSYVNNAAEDRSGNIYFTVNKNNSLLVWKSKQQHFEQWNMDSVLHLDNKLTTAIFIHIIDSNQNLWISYEKAGLLKYNLLSHMAKLYTAEDGLQSNNFDCLVNDDAGNIWIPTEKGLNCWLAATDKFVNFTTADGLPFTNFHDCYLYLDKDDGSLYFSKEGYLFKINATQLLSLKKQHNVKLLIDAMQVNGKPYYFSNINDIRLQPNENNISFTFTLVDLGQTILQRNYEYLLTRNNEKSNWQKLNTSNILAFSTLEAGFYTLQIRMPDEVTSTYITGSNSVQFYIRTRWYDTNWFIGLAIATSIFIIWSFIHLYYQRKVERQKGLFEKADALKEERNRIAADMHDDVGAGLSRIRYITAAIKEGKGLNNDDLDKIMNLSDESIEKMNEIIWGLNQGDRNLSELLYHIRSQCAAMVNNANLTFVCELPAAIPQMNVGWSASRNIYMLVKEAVNNAVKHAAATSITVHFSFQLNILIIVSDNGKGYNVTTASKEGNGIKNYEKRTAALNGTFNIATSDTAGTKVMFKLALTPQQPT